MTANPKGVRATKDGGLFIHPKALDVSKDASEGSSIRIPQVTTELGAGFGDEIADSDREFAAEREPVAHFLTYGISADVFDKWFTIDDPSSEGGDPHIDEAVQEALTDLKAKEKLTEALEYERIYGWSLLIGSFNDISSVQDLDRPLREGSQLLQLVAYPKTKVQAWVTDKRPDSPRFNEVAVYKIDRGAGEFLYVHYSRCHRVETRTGGFSVLDPIWDDLCCGRNIRWGAAQWMYRTGGGFPVIKFPPGTTQEQLEAWVDGGSFSNLMSRSYIGITADMEFKFEGAAGRALDPQPFFQTNDEQIAKGTGVPQPKLVGAQAGAVVGSELNQQEYYKGISRIQAKLESTVRWPIDKLIESRQITVTGQRKVDHDAESLITRVGKWLRMPMGDALPKPEPFKYVINWESAFELTELDQKQSALYHEQANAVRLKYMTIDEVRALNELEELPNGEGAKLQTFQPAFGEPQTFGEEGDEEFTVIRHRSIVGNKGGD